MEDGRGRLVHRPRGSGTPGDGLPGVGGRAARDLVVGGVLGSWVARMQRRPERDRGRDPRPDKSSNLESKPRSDREHVARCHAVQRVHQRQRPDNPGEVGSGPTRGHATLSLISLSHRTRPAGPMSQASNCNTVCQARKHLLFACFSQSGKRCLQLN